MALRSSGSPISPRGRSISPKSTHSTSSKEEILNSEIDSKTPQSKDDKESKPPDSKLISEFSEMGLNSNARHLEVPTPASADSKITEEEETAALEKSIELASHISDEEMERFSELRTRLKSDKPEGFVRQLIRRGKQNEALEFLENLSDRYPSEERLSKLGIYQQNRTRKGSTPLEKQFQEDIQHLQLFLENQILLEIATHPDLASESGISETDQAIIGFLNSLSGDGFDGLSTKDKITRCFSLCDQAYKKSQTIPARFQPLVNFLQADMSSAFIKSHSRTNPTLTMDHNGKQYLRKSGLHEFVKVEHRVENFLMSIGQHPTKIANEDYRLYSEARIEGKTVKLSFNDVYEVLQVDTASLMFYQLDAAGNQIIDEETGEIEITGGGHPGAALAKRDEARLAEKKEAAAAKEKTEVSVAAQSIDGSYQFHMDLSDAFYRSFNPGELVKNLYEEFNKHCYDGVLRPKQITKNRVLHISGARLHSHGKKARIHFAKEINALFDSNEKMFTRIMDKWDIEYEQISRDRASTTTSGSSESSKKSDYDTYLEKLKLG